MTESFVAKGKVYLVGAGPGDPGLLTVEASRLLQTADAVFHDELVSPEILALIPEQVYVENVGKRCGQARVSQQQIHSLMINAAREGWTVVRLKSGDPLIFGRSGEEIEALRDAEIECVIVPGITAAFGAAARAGIPLTDRRLASKLVFLSNHQCAGKSGANWDSAISGDTTALIYMPGSEYEELAAQLCEQGFDLETPCLLVSHATTAEERIYLASLSSLVDAPRFAAPVVLIVGAVAANYLARKTGLAQPAEDSQFGLKLELAKLRS